MFLMSQFFFHIYFNLVAENGLVLMKTKLLLYSKKFCNFSRSCEANVIKALA